MKSTREINTSKWLQEYQYGCDLRAMPSLNLEACDSQNIKNRSLIMLPEFGGLSLLVLSFKKNANLLLVPTSEFAHPANEFEVALPESNLVLQTWNARVVSQADLGAYEIIGQVPQADMRIAQNHYASTFRDIEFAYSSQTGAPLESLDESAETLVLDYVQNESTLLPESTFIVLDIGILEEIFEEILEENEKKMEAGEEALSFMQMPTMGAFDSDLKLAAASKKPKGDTKK